MQFYSVTLSGKLTPGDVVYVHWCDRRGGRSSGGHEIQGDRIVNDTPVKADTVETVMAALAVSIDRYFPSFFKVQHVGTNKLLIVADGQPAGDIIPEVKGKKTESLTIKEGLNG